MKMALPLRVVAQILRSSVLRHNCQNDATLFLSLAKRFLATAAGKDEDDYEFDLISMRNLPKKKKRKEFIDPNAIKKVPVLNAALSKARTSHDSYLHNDNESSPNSGASEEGAATAGNAEDLNARTFAFHLQDTAQPSSSPTSEANKRRFQVQLHDKRGKSILSWSTNAQMAPNSANSDITLLDVFVGENLWPLRQFHKFVCLKTQGLTFDKLTAIQFEKHLIEFKDLNLKGQFFAYCEDIQKAINETFRLLSTRRGQHVELEWLLQKWSLDLEGAFRFWSELDEVAKMVDLSTHSGKYVAELISSLVDDTDTRMSEHNYVASNSTTNLDRFLLSQVVEKGRKENLAQILFPIKENLVGVAYALQGKVRCHQSLVVDLKHRKKLMLRPGDLNRAQCISTDANDVETLLFEMLKAGYRDIFLLLCELAKNGILDNASLEMGLGRHLISDDGQVVSCKTFRNNMLNLRSFVPRLKILQGTIPFYRTPPAELLQNVKRLTELLHACGNNSDLIELALEHALIARDIDMTVLDDFIFDAMLQDIAQSEPQQVELAKTPYIQIPDSLDIHELTQELRLLLDVLKHDRGVNSFGHCSDTTILTSLDDFIDKSRTLKPDGVSSLIKLRQRLGQLFGVNGGETTILDTLLTNQSVFDNFERKRLTHSSREYIQIPDDFNIEEFSSELRTVKQVKGIKSFAEVPCSVISSTVDAISKDTVHFDSKQRMVFAKLFKNLTFLFNYNNQNLFVLDQVINSWDVFNAFERRLKPISAIPGNNTIKQDHDVKDTFDFQARSLTSVKSLRKGDFARDEKEKHEKFRINDFRNSKTASRKYNDSERFVWAVSEKKQRAELDNPKFVSPRHKYPEKHHEDLSLKKLQGYLEDAKKEKELRKEKHFRERRAYDWSNSMFKSHRSLEARNFFSPVPFWVKEEESPLQGRLHNEKAQYLLITTDGQSIVSKENPLGPSHSPEDMFVILSKFPREDLHNHVKNVKRLQRKNWILIGGGGEEGMLVFARENNDKRGWLFAKLKSGLAVAGAVFILLIGSNYYLEKDQPAFPDSPLHEHVQPRPFNVAQAVNSNSETLDHELSQQESHHPSLQLEVIGPKPLLTIVNNLSDEKRQSSSWRRWLWRLQ